MPIKNIYIKGNNIIPDSEIITLAKLNDKSSFILTNNYTINKNLKKKVYIKRATIKKKFWGKLYINIEEYKIICSTNEDKIILANGKTLDNTYIITDIPRLINNIEDKEIQEKFINKFDKINSNILRQISQIEYSPVDVDNERFLLYMDNGNLVYVTLTRIERLNKYNEIVESMNGNYGIIYLDSGNYIELKDNTEVIDANDIDNNATDTTTTVTDNNVEENNENINTDDNE